MNRSPATCNDDDEAWQSDTTDIFSVILHEIGHALGLGHSDLPGTVMYPYYRRFTELQSHDIDALQALYTPHDPSSDQAGPKLLLSVPSPLTTTTDRVTLSGIALGNENGIVRWQLGSNEGIADGSGEWTARDIPIDVGHNLVAITALTSGNSVTKSVSVTRLAHGTTDWR